MSRPWLSWLLGLLLGAATLAFSTRWVDVASTRLVEVQSLAPVAGAGIVGVTLLALVCRRRRLALVGAAPSVVALVMAGLPFVPHTVPAGQGDLTIVSSNLEFGRAEAADVLAAVSDHHADVLVLLEVTPAAATRLTAAGLDRTLPYVAGTAEAGASGTLIRSRYPLTLLDEGLGETGGDFSLRQPVARVDAPGRPFVVKAIHPLPPVGFPESWRTSLALTQRWVGAQPSSEPLVLAGDFNASMDHPAYREVASGLTDAHRAAGGGWVLTWPSNSRVPPFVQIDHVLVRSFGVVDAGTVSVRGTDHRAVWATIRQTG